jgi:hypothetical protein
MMETTTQKTVPTPESKTVEIPVFNTKPRTGKDVLSSRKTAGGTNEELTLFKSKKLLAELLKYGNGYTWTVSQVEDFLDRLDVAYTGLLAYAETNKISIETLPLFAPLQGAENAVTYLLENSEGDTVLFNLSEEYIMCVGAGLAVGDWVDFAPEPENDTSELDLKTAIDKLTFDELPTAHPLRLEIEKQKIKVDYLADLLSDGLFSDSTQSYLDRAERFAVKKMQEQSVSDLNPENENEKQSA